MSRLSESDYLLEQYKTSDNLDARRDLHSMFSTEKWIFDQIDMTPDGNLIEAGCGTGALWLENVDRIPPGWQITLSDMSPGMLEKTRTDLASSSSDITCKTFDIQEIPEEMEHST